VRLLGLAAVFVTPVAITKMSTAGFTAQELRAHVEIDGVDYGEFDHIEGLSQFRPEASPETGAEAPASFTKVSFKRDFVTDPSLYLWAKNTMHGRTDLHDVHVVLKSRDGEEISHYVLRDCQPLSWTVEAANPALGGFHEKIDLAVQEISLF
jgi:hypothetical protein